MIYDKKNVKNFPKITFIAYYTDKYAQKSASMYG